MMFSNHDIPPITESEAPTTVEEAPARTALPGRSHGAATGELEIIPENHVSHLEFNVMPGRPVAEDLLIREYRVGDRYVEAHFDRTYESSMKASPSHLIFLSTLVHTQKMLYVVLCREFGFDYDPNGAEHFKMWPTKVEVKIPKLIPEEEGLVQKLWIKKLQRFDDKTYRVTAETQVGSLRVRCVVPTFIL